MKIILGVDGGNSKTHAAVVGEDGQYLGAGVAAGSNHQVGGIDAALANIRTAALAALRQANLTPADVHFVQYGLAGADMPHDFAILRPALASLPFSSWDVVCDTEEGLRTGSKDNRGVVLVCGSGTNAMGRNRAGQVAQTGGVDYWMGDSAGGHFLAAETLRRAIRSWEYREEVSLLPSHVAEHLGYPSMEALYYSYLEQNVRDVPDDLTLVLHETAKQGDHLAACILTAVGRELGLAANSVVKRLGGFDDKPFPVVLTGSVLQKGRSPHLFDALESTVLTENPSAQLVIPEMAPVYGAVLLAFDHLSLHTSDALMGKFATYGGYKL